MKKLLSVVVFLSVLALGAPGGSTGAAHASVRRAGSQQPAGPQLPELAPAPNDALTRALHDGALTEAEYSLDRALTLFTPGPVARSFGHIAKPAARSATALLRDLALRRDDLSAADRATADALLTRPTDAKKGDPIDIKYGQATAERTCTPNLCIHYTITGKHKVADVDSDGNGRPDYVDTVVSVLQERVRTRTIEELGYRKPKSDRRSSNNGGNGKTDFYLADLGSFSVPLYGYCASDDPHLRRRSGYRFSDMSAYCVFDNDYSPDQFPDQTPLANLQVTAAHEFFHAVQFAYDIFEDLWFLENTAVWMEDEVYGDINDNLQYLSSSSMRHPHVPLDYGASFFEYGNFIFWKYASERFGRRFVKQVWNKADGARGEPNRYSLRAARSVIERHSAFGKTFINFAIANFAPENHYDKGPLYEAEVNGARINKRFALGPAKRSTSEVRRRLDHLTNVYISFAPRDGVDPDARLRVKVDGPGRKSKPKATLVSYEGSKVIDKKPVDLDGRGVGRARMPFGKVTRVLLVLTNASTRYKRCFTNPLSPFSCAGVPVDQNKSFTFKAKLIL